MTQVEHTLDGHHPSLLHMLQQEDNGVYTAPVYGVRSKSDEEIVHPCTRVLGSQDNQRCPKHVVACVLVRTMFTVLKDKSVN